MQNSSVATFDDYAKDIEMSRKYLEKLRVGQEVYITGLLGPRVHLDPKVIIPEGVTPAIIISIGYWTKYRTFNKQTQKENDVWNEFLDDEFDCDSPEGLTIEQYCEKYYPESFGIAYFKDVKLRVSYWSPDFELKYANIESAKAQLKF